MPEETQDQQDQQQPQQPVEDAQPAAEAAQTAGEAEEQEDQGPQNAVAVEDAGVLRKKVTVTVPRRRIDAKFDEMFGELSTSAQVPGFRIGRAPRRLIEKRFGKEVSRDVRNALIGEALGDALEKSALKTLGEPEGDVDKVELPETGDMQFSFEVEVMPEFGLPELKGIKVERPEVKVTDEKLEEAFAQYRESQVRYDPTDESAQEGDSITGSAKISGEGISAVERPGLALRVAPGQVEGLPLVDLGKALAGKKAGDTASVTVKVPAAHPNEEWREKEVTVEITVSQVSRRVLPEAEEVAKSMGYDSVEDFRDHLRRYMEARRDLDARREMRNQIRKYLLDNTDFELPPGVLRTYATRALRKRYVELMNAGVPQERINENLTRLQADVSEQSRRDLKLLLIMNRIADEEHVEVSEEEVNAGIAEMARAYNRRPERLKQELDREGALSAVADSLRDDKILDMLLDEAEIAEAEVQPGQAVERQGEQGSADEQ